MIPKDAIGFQATSAIAVVSQSALERVVLVRKFAPVAHADALIKYVFGCIYMH